MDETAAQRAAQEAAHDDLQFIRRTLAASGNLSIVPGKGMVTIGILTFVVIAIGLRWIGTPAQVLNALRTDSFFAPLPYVEWLYLWGILFVASLVIGAWMMWLKARRTEQVFWSPVLRKALWGYVPAMGLGGILTYISFGRPEMIPVVWLGCYGVASMAAGAVSISPIRWMGVCFLLLAGLAAVTPPALSMILLGLGFGWLHISFGAYIAWRHDG